ncbi:Predicted house-cleaning noncanonical NTP pyrophosphatase, all-alpha NTP-PPase (MazG) superfamily [Virgibacillus subterraneus]|uniref:Predicted house-cleaning noncanonical NTP pyrophosphatase, all-alpha NTP-PPase (MazG) superfamily n=2 Tax=Virgibacillus TaxID=84406 RepID=A0A1H0Y062_9BACI|nr:MULTISPECIES: nucleoside triphosphate pyrophosphohydrolase [Virgibacillus]SDQ08518.1 Predicted house-cleaning noncanonical NTP pyrophosphatase, all-alpha NTP-PPase (MazG) superfamily [Virgibacillus salinus]SEP64836.1 Predicted house-cleaning noncanonical NTP pyrophosphatase, all-alpha NTP-PPase (MazG) superfamily [Virgibacillus subterraneus]
MPTYNKLIRDKIPGIIAMTGKKANTATLSDEDYIKELRKKTKEELQEYLAADNDSDALDELADLLELMHTLANVHESSMEEVEKIREKKAEQRGGFNDRVFLIDVE